MEVGCSSQLYLIPLFRDFLMPLYHSDPNLPLIRSSAAQLLGYVIQELFPDALLVGGEAGDIGFTYDFISDRPVDSEVLELLDVRLRTLIKESKEVTSSSMMRENAFAFFMHLNQPVLASLALAADTNIVSLFRTGAFNGLCPEPHVRSTDEVGSVKLMQIEKTRRELPDRGWVDITRIKGTAFSDPMSLKKFLKSYEKLKKCDHRLLGPEMNLFAPIENVSAIEYSWLPKGVQLCDILLGFWEEYRKKHDVQKVVSPILCNDIPSRHSFPSFRLEEQTCSLSASRLKHHLGIYNRRGFDDADLPVRLGEVATLFEYKQESRLWGLFNERVYRSDLITIFCREDQADSEINYFLQFIEQIVRIFEFEAHWYLVGVESKTSGTKQYKHACDKLRKQACERFRRILTSRSICYQEEKGQKEKNDESQRVEPVRIEVRFADSLGREWVGSSIGAVFPSQEETLKTEKGSDPVILAATVFSSLHRFVGLLVENRKGFLPFWLAPEQVRVLSIGEQNKEYAEQVYRSCIRSGLRSALDCRDEKLGMKVHAAEKERVPYLLIIGDKEAGKKRVSVRSLQDSGEECLKKECLKKECVTDLEDFILSLQEKTIPDPQTL